MQPLRVSQLPFVRTEGSAQAALVEEAGFVDEEVVTKLVARPSARRTQAKPSDMVLSADDLDFAGWDFPTQAHAREAKPEFGRKPAEFVPADTPEVAPLKFSRSHETHQDPGGRWWLAGLLGVVAVIVISLVLIKLIAPASFDVKPSPVSEEIRPLSPAAP